MWGRRKTLAAFRCLRSGMRKVLILLDAEFGAASWTIQMVKGFKEAIADSSPLTQVESGLISELDWSTIAPQGAVICPLTLDIPEQLVFPGRSIYRICRDISATRLRVEQELGVPTGDGNFWLPVVWTVKGPLYGEAIGLKDPATSNPFPVSSPTFDPQYRFPLHLSDIWRQPLYAFAYRLLRSLQAPPATYLIQFGFQGREIYFDRLWPFPAAPAIATLGVQSPDLLSCHWHCLTGKPIYDIQVRASATARADG